MPSTSALTRERSPEPWVRLPLVRFYMRPNRTLSETPLSSTATRYAAIGVLLLVAIVTFPKPSLALQVQQTFWSSNTYFQGDGGSVTVSLYGDSSSCGCMGAGVTQLYVEEVVMQFDWQRLTNQSYSTKVGENLTVGSTTAYVIRISIPGNASVGPHDYTIYYVGQNKDTHSLAAGTLQIHDANERVYDGLLLRVQKRLDVAANATFQSQDAKSWLRQARTNFTQARTLANTSQFLDAVTTLNVASNLIDQAYSTEQSYQARPQSQPGIQPRQETQNPVLLGGIAAAVGVIATLSLFLRSRKPNHSTG